jgi:hypothetical protein
MGKSRSSGSAVIRWHVARAGESPAGHEPATQGALAGFGLSRIVALGPLVGVVFDGGPSHDSRGPPPPRPSGDPASTAADPGPRLGGLPPPDDPLAHPRGAAVGALGPTAQPNLRLSHRNECAAPFRNRQRIDTYGRSTDH